MSTVRVGIAGGSGYGGGELLRLLLFHPGVNIGQVTSRRFAGKRVGAAHPNLRGITDLKFCRPDQLEPCDVLFLAMPHGQALEDFPRLRDLVPRIIDLSGDFRLDSNESYRQRYGEDHPYPGELARFVYGIPELHRAAMAEATHISSAGCNATATILGLHPLYKLGLVDTERTVIEVKTGTSQGGNAVGPGTHHPDRSGSIRCYRPVQHRHAAEIRQELGLAQDHPLHFTATGLDMVRGVHMVAHVFLNDEAMDDKAVWQVYREAYGREPFVRIVREMSGLHRLPDPSLLAGTNYCDVGFVRDPESNRLVVVSAIDNLVKGAAGQALQAFNIMTGHPETLGLEFSGLYPN